MLGFTGVRGVNITADCLAWNRWLQEYAGYTESPFILYDGQHLPFLDGSQDMVFSQQVVEHVVPELIEPYYRETGRVLRDGGLAIFQIPHRLAPYDSHTRTWFVHWLPRWAQPGVYRWLGRDYNWVNRELFLRTLWCHWRLTRRWIGKPHNMAHKRFISLSTTDIAAYYDGPIHLRNWLARLVMRPLIGPLLARMISPWLMAETIVVKDARVAATARTPKYLVFLLSDHLIDFDTYLPIALSLKRVRPEYDIRFVTLSRENHDFIRSNPTLVRGLEKCGKLFVLDWTDKGRYARSLSVAGTFMRIAFWLAARPGSVIFHGRQFTALPYAVLYLLNRLLGGRGLILVRSRQPDAGVKLNIRPRFESFTARRSIMEKFFGRDYDALIHYHDVQDLYLRSLGQWGRINRARAISIGLPHLLPEWRTMIEDETERTRRELKRDGLDPIAVYAVFAPKSFSSKFLRLPDSAERSFRLVIEALKELKPAATILVRPHPRALHETWLNETITAVGHPRLRVTLLHPEVLCALAARTIAPNTTTTMMIAAKGQFIDCTDYPPEHYAVLGERSLCDGYNTIFVNPAHENFRDQFAAALSDEPWSDTHKLARERDDLIRRNPPRLDLLLSAIEDPLP